MAVGGCGKRCVDVCVCERERVTMVVVVKDLGEQPEAMTRRRNLDSARASGCFIEAWDAISIFRLQFTRSATYFSGTRPP